MSQQQPDRASPAGSAVIVAVSGALIGASFGRVWLSMGAKDLHGWRHAIEFVGWTVLGLFVIAGVLVALRARRTRPQWGGARPRLAWAAWFGLVCAAEVALIAGGQQLLGGTFGHPDWIPVWTLFVVGAHFWPFALVLKVDAFHVLAGTLCTTAVVSTIVAALAGMPLLWSVLPGFGGAAVLWGFTGWALHRMASGRSLA